MDADDQTAVYSSTASDVATVSTTGLVTALTPGTTNILVGNETDTVGDSITVTVTGA